MGPEYKSPNCNLIISLEMYTGVYNKEIIFTKYVKGKILQYPVYPWKNKRQIQKLKKKKTGHLHMS